MLFALFSLLFSHCVQAHLTGARMNLCISIPIRGILRASRALILLIWHKNRSQQFEYSKPCLVLCKCFHIKNKLIYYYIWTRERKKTFANLTSKHCKLSNTLLQLYFCQNSSNNSKKCEKKIVRNDAIIVTNLQVSELFFINKAIVVYTKLC